MKRILASILTCLIIVLVSLTASGDALAGQFMPASIRDFFVTSVTQSDKDAMAQLQTEVMPQLEAILSPEQVEMFETEIASGTSFRKTFKSLMLMPEQKADLKSLLKSLPQRNTFAALTPTQKKRLFLEKKEAFTPSSDEIIDRINAKIETSGGTLPEGVREKIDAGVRAKDTFQPSPESIMEKIEAGIDSAKETLSGD